MSPPVREPVEGSERNRRPDSPLPAMLLAVFAAGVLGTAARLGADLVLPAQAGGPPWSTLLINTVGSFALGVVVAALSDRAPEWLRAGLTTGLLGSFTTFSALTVASVALTGPGVPVSTAILLIVSVAAGIAAALAGLALGSKRRRA